MARTAHRAEGTTSGLGRSSSSSFLPAQRPGGLRDAGSKLWHFPAPLRAQNSPGGTQLLPAPGSGESSLELLLLPWERGRAPGALGFSLHWEKFGVGAEMREEQGCAWQCLCSGRICAAPLAGPQNQKSWVVWVGRNLKTPQFPNPLPWAGMPHQIAPSPVQTGLEKWKKSQNLQYSGFTLDLI